MRKKLFAVTIAISMLFRMTACGAADDAVTTEYQSESNREESNPEDSSGQESLTVQKGAELPEESSEPAGSNILIAYFTWADNTVVEDEEAAVQSALSHYESVGDRTNYGGVDATTSASVLAPGNTAQMAGWIQERTGGDLFSIVVSEPYSSNYDECLDRAADEKAEDARLELAEHVEHMQDYKIVFLGFPNWWSSAPMAVFSFLEEYDFTGKTVIPFCAHGTGGIGSSVRDITAALPDGTEVGEAIGIYRADMHEAQETVNGWLDSLGFVQKQASLEQAEEGEAETSEQEERMIRMVVDGQEFLVTLYDTPTANALYDMLPLELQFEDFNGVEKIGYLPETLPTKGEPAGCDPDVGDLCLYAPWGNLSVFYKDFRYSEGLIMLGHMESGTDVISRMEGDFSVGMEKVD